MPSRKSGSSDTAPDSRRSSLHRFSSIASFQALFTRRRSNNASSEASAAASSSNLSLLSTIANAPEPQCAVASTNASQDEDSITALPQRPQPQPQPHAAPSQPRQQTSRRSSYICLPDDPIGGMPRSRTFSNLPLPTRGKRTRAASIVPSKSHALLPSGFIPSTRLPSPPTSTRKHSHTRLASVENKLPLLRNRVKRSDTQPLLGVNGQSSSHLPRSTAFKENISLSPIKPLSALDLQEESDAYSQPGHPELLSSCSTPKDDQHPALRMSRESRSSPAYRHQQPISGAEASFQRWNSQPVLTHPVSNRARRNSLHTEVKQSRLMSARQPPTPPPKTPLTSSSALPSSKVKHANNHNIRQLFEQTPLPSRSTLSTTKSPSPPPQPSSLLHISAVEAPAYWSGRLCALVDRYRNEELPNNIGEFTHTPSKAQTDKMHLPEANTARLRKAFEYLYSLCTTSEAKDSLMLFQGQFAAVWKLPELAVDVTRGSGRNTIVLGSRSTAVEGEALTMSESRKVSFMDRLLGRQTKRRSSVLV